MEGDDEDEKESISEKDEEMKMEEHKKMQTYFDNTRREEKKINKKGKEDTDSTISFDEREVRNDEVL